MGKPHKYAEVIKAWADGADVEYRYEEGAKWRPCKANPSWHAETQFRIKPPPIRYRNVLMDGVNGPYVVTVMYSDKEVDLSSNKIIRFLDVWKEVEV